MAHISETDKLLFPKRDTIYIDTNVEKSELKKTINEFLNQKMCSKNK